MFNIKSVLKEHGLEIVETFQDYKILRIRFDLEELQRRLPKKELYDYDLTGIYEVEITELEFDYQGNISFCLECTGNCGHFEQGDTFDVIEFI